MKKNLGTSRDPRQESPDRGKWSKVRHLGFVVDFGLPPTDALTHALINLAEAPNRWYVVGLSADNYPPETKAVVPRFFETVFVAAVNALLTYERHGELRLDEVIMERTVPQYALLAFKLRQWARSDTSDSASPDFPVLRLSIYHSLFGARGTKRDLDVVWKGESGPDAIFLWTPQKLKSSPFMNLGDGPFQTIELAGFAPETELAVESVTGLTKALTAQLSAVWPPGIKTTAPIANYQTYVRRQWEMDWQPAKISVGGDGHPPFIGDQGIRVLRLSKPGYTPRHFLRVEYLRRLRAETYRRHMSRQILPSKYGLQRYRNNAERLLSEAGSDPSGIPREAWRPITRQELCAKIGRASCRERV